MPNSDMRRQQAYRLWTLNADELHRHIPRAAKLRWFVWALALKEGTPYLNNSQNGNLILQRLLALPLKPTNVKKRVRTDFDPSAMGEGMDDIFPDNPERRSFSDHGVKRLKVKCDGDSGSPGTSTKITQVSGLAAGPLDLTGVELKPLIQLVKGASHQGSETVSMNQDASVSHNPPFDNQAETSVLKCRATSDITRNMTMTKSPQSPQPSPVSTLNGFQESTTHETVVIKTRHYKPKLHGSEVRRGWNGMLGIYWVDSFKARHAFSIWAPQAIKGLERAYFVFL